MRSCLMLTPRTHRRADEVSSKPRCETDTVRTVSAQPISFKDVGYLDSGAHVRSSSQPLAPSQRTFHLCRYQMANFDSVGRR